MKVKDRKNVKSNIIKTLLIKNLISNGILINASHNISFSHSKADLNYVISCYDKIFKNLMVTIESKSVELKFPPIEPIFTPRKN